MGDFSMMRMRPAFGWVWVFVVILSAVATAAWAQGGGSGSEADEAPAGTEKEVSLQFREPKPLNIVLEYIKERTGAEIVYDEKNIQGVMVEVDLKKVYWQKALEIIAKQYGLSLKDLGNNVIEVYKPPTVTMEFDQAPLRSVITLIAKWADKNVVMSPAIESGPPITLRLKNVPWREALEAVVKTAGFELIEETDRIFRVVTRAESQQQTETEIFPLRYIRPQDLYLPRIQSDLLTTPTAPTAATGVSGGSGGGTTGAGRFQSFTLLAALQTMLTANTGRLHYFSETNTVFVTDAKPVITRIQDIINKLDVEPQQIFVDVKFVRTLNQDFLDFGFDFPNGLQVSQSFGALATRFPFTTGAGGFEDRIVADFALDRTRPGGFPPAQPPSAGFPGQSIANVLPAALNPASLYSFGTMDFSQTQITLRLLKEDVKSEILQAPKLVTLDHHEATIFVGRTIHYAQTELVQNDNGTTSVQVVEAEGSPVTDGFQLLISPHIIPGSNQIVMTIIPKNEETELVPFGPVEQQILLPTITTQTLVTHMILESGQTMVVGGLYRLANTESVRKLPYLGDIPLLGWFFKFKDVDKVREDLLVFITPRIVESATTRSKVIQQEVDKHRAKLYEDFNRLLQEGNPQPQPMPGGGP